MKWTEKWKCNECGTEWLHEWDNEDKNNDYTQCPNDCIEFDIEPVD